MNEASVQELRRTLEQKASDAVGDYRRILEDLARTAQRDLAAIEQHGALPQTNFIDVRKVAALNEISAQYRQCHEILRGIDYLTEHEAGPVDPALEDGDCTCSGPEPINGQIYCPKHG